HPGYGFLSENAAFAKACVDAGIVFVGPPADAIALMGDKRASKNAVEAAGVRGVPGYQGEDDDDASLLAAAEDIGVPLMVKASAGGGGRGMRLVRDLAGLPDALRAARAEAQSAFGSGALILERAVLSARHVEIQVFADAHGTVLHFGERDCSIQRRHQKVIEEAPSPAVTPELRRAMGEAACAAARSCGYVGAGTVEFLLEDDGSFWFLEMNTRLQVEHPVTEEVTMLDLVALQLRVAAGLPLEMEQDDVELVGHAIEARLYAEDPDRDFLPQTGTVHRFDLPTGVRFDHAIVRGGVVSPHYDPMLGKLIAYGRDREEARGRLAAALDSLVLHGVVTNRAWLGRLLRDERVVAGDVTTRFLDEHGADLLAGPPTLAERAVACLVALVEGSPGTPLDRLGWRSGRNVPALVVLECGEHESSLRVLRTGAGEFEVRSEETVVVTLVALQEGALTVTLDGRRRTVPYSRHGSRLWVGDRVYDDITQRPAESADGGTGTIAAPLDGAVTSTFVSVGDRVSAGQLLLVMEAMKMEHRMTADVDGVVEAMPVSVGDQVKTRQLLVVITEEDA
ncbi:MAG: biotin/lipoyl-binding protein, partial [Deltaproteobacteria bacterium]|nr:biotin/lipoyl-binding protein [Deltaproteobacteria bacterium]